MNKYSKFKIMVTAKASEKAANTLLYMLGGAALITSIFGGIALILLAI